MLAVVVVVAVSVCAKPGSSSGSRRRVNMCDAHVLHLVPAEAFVPRRKPAAPGANAPVRLVGFTPRYPAIFHQKSAAAKEKVIQIEGKDEPQLSDLVNDGPQEGALLRPTLLQVVLILASAMGMMMLGGAITWPNALAGDIHTDNSTFLGHQLSISPVGHDLVGSLMFVGCAVGTMPSSWLVGKFGRRICLAAATVPCVIAWAIITFAHMDLLLYVGRFLTGVGMSVLVTSSKMYAAEVANTSIRGMASTLLETMKVVGFVVMVAAAISIPWYVIACASAVLLLLFGVGMSFVPESPNYLTLEGREEEARQVLRRLRGPRADVDMEISHIKKMNMQSDSTSGFSALLRRDVMKDIGALMVLLVLRSFCGSEVISVHCTRMLMDSGVSLDPTLGTLMVNSAYMSGGFILTVIVDRLGRRWSMMVSLVVVAVGYAALGCLCFFFPASPQPAVEMVLLSPHNANATFSYMSEIKAELSHVSDAGGLLPLFCFLTVAFGIGLGIANVPMVLMVEYFPTNIRALGMGICLTFLSAVSAVVTQLYSVMVGSLTQAGLYWLFAGSAVAAMVHTLLFIRETNKTNIG